MAALLSRRPFAPTHLIQMYGAGDESRTRDLNLGKVALYQLSYSRSENPHFTQSPHIVKLHFSRSARCFGPLYECLVGIKKSLRFFKMPS